MIDLAFINSLASRYNVPTQTDTGTRYIDCDVRPNIITLASLDGKREVTFFEWYERPDAHKGHMKPNGEPIINARYKENNRPLSPFAHDRFRLTKTAIHEAFRWLVSGQRSEPTMRDICGWSLTSKHPS